MSLRQDFTTALKTAMQGGDKPRVAALRMITARLKDLDIAARPAVTDGIAEPEILSMLRGMVKTRRESVALYAQGNRPDLVAQEEAEIAVIESFLPAQMDNAATESAVAEAIAATGATSIKDMGKVMAALKERHAATLDMARVGPMVKAKLG